MRCRVSTCGGTISQNSTHIQNPGYPSGYTTSTTCSYTLSKSSSDICSFRLDFVAFVITATTTTSSTSTNNACNYDTVGLDDRISISLYIFIVLPEMCDMMRCAAVHHCAKPEQSSHHLRLQHRPAHLPGGQPHQLRPRGCLHHHWSVKLRANLADKGGPDSLRHHLQPPGRVSSGRTRRKRFLSI